jgi:Protein of unknown function (DUF727)
MPRKELTKQQASHLTSEEYNQLRLSYPSLFQSVSLTDSSLIELSTLEGETYALRVTADGWRVIAGGKPSERERTWEMVEDVLRSVSPLFAEGWNAQLLQKLQALADAGHGGPSDEECTPTAQSQ